MTQMIALLGRGLIQIVIRIGIDWVPVVGRCFFSHLVSSSAQPTQHRGHPVEFGLAILAFGFVQRRVGNFKFLSADFADMDSKPHGSCDLCVAD